MSSWSLERVQVWVSLGILHWADLVGWLQLRQVQARGSQSALHRGHPDETVKDEASVVKGFVRAQHRACPGMMSGAKVGMDWGVPGCNVQGKPWSNCWT